MIKTLQLNAALLSFVGNPVCFVVSLVTAAPSESSFEPSWPLPSGSSMATRDGCVSRPVGKIQILSFATGLLMFLSCSEVWPFCSLQLDLLSIHAVMRSADETFESTWLHLEKVGCQIVFVAFGLVAALEVLSLFQHISRLPLQTHIMSNPDKPQLNEYLPSLAETVRRSEPFAVWQ